MQTKNKNTFIILLRPCQAVGAPNVPHDIAAEREKEERLPGATLLFGALRISRTRFLVRSFCYITLS